MEDKKSKGLICNKCGYNWNTRSKLFFVTCPRCMRKIKNGNIELKDNLEDD